MKNNALIITLIIVIGVLILGYGLMGKFPSTGKTLESQGTSVIKSMPDEASVYINIETLDSSSDLSKTKNDEISKKVNDSLKLLSVDKIETSQYNIYEDFEYNYQTGERKSKGFKTINVLKVTVTDFDKIGKIIDGSVSSGATGISTINFELSQTRQAELKKQALSEASNDARTKAESVASGLGSKVTDIVSVSTSDFNYMPYPFLTRAEGSLAKSAADAGTSISPQELEVRANVNVVFRLK